MEHNEFIAKHPPMVIEGDKGNVDNADGNENERT